LRERVAIRVTDQYQLDKGK